MDLSGFLQPFADIATFFKALGDPHMWRSLGWLFLGILLIGLGVTQWAAGTGVGKAAIGGLSKGVV